MTHSPTRILAVKLADIGDLLLITPALRALRRAYPAATLDVLLPSRGAAALANLSFIDDLLLFDKYPFDSPLQALRSGRWGELIRFARRLRGRDYDTVILFHHLSLRFGALKHAALVLATGAPCRIGLDARDGRAWFLTHRVLDQGFGAKHELDYWLDLAAAAGAPAVSRQVEIGLTDEDIATAVELLPPADRPTVAIHPGSGGYSLARRWGLEKFAGLGERLRQECDARVLVVGTQADGVDDLAASLGGNVINLGGRTTLTQLAAVLARCDLLVGADSGVLHVASAVGTSIVALFGPTNHRAWAPALPPDRLTVIRSGIACSPCSYTRQGLGTPAGCPERTCMALISVDQVFQAAETALARKKETD
jgi:heptosyltransferase-2